MIKKILFILLLSLFFISCAHHRDVRPGASGVHKVAVQTDDKEKGAREALDQANHFCKERAGGKMAAIISEKQKYTGSMDESSYKTGKTVSKAAQAVGGAAWVFGGKKESNIGGVAMLGGSAADSVLGNGYTVTMKFKCQ